MKLLIVAALIAVTNCQVIPAPTTEQATCIAGEASNLTPQQAQEFAQCTSNTNAASATSLMVSP
jgi:predicted lipoprotein